MSLHMVFDRYNNTIMFHQAKRKSAKLALAMKDRIKASRRRCSEVLT